MAKKVNPPLPRRTIGRVVSINWHADFGVELQQARITKWVGGGEVLQDGAANALLPDLISKVPNIVPVFAGALGWAAAGDGVIVSFLPSLIEEGKHQKRSDDFGLTLSSFLTKYEIDGVEGGSFRDIPDNEWPGYEDGPTIGS
ncbi:hypothetical protein AAIB41_17645 [Brucella sp. BE17]|uniref:hypothetical protein n=1 Tax=Brucella sp. BE17 TaxID=3142977 RepID=UPI0031BB6519